jgi:hypothetical protein
LDACSSYDYTSAISYGDACSFVDPNFNSSPRAYAGLYLNAGTYSNAVPCSLFYDSTIRNVYA